MHTEPERPVSRRRETLKAGDGAISVRFCIGGIAEAISQPRLGQNILRVLGIALDLFAKHPDVRSQVLEFAAILRAPDRSQELYVGERKSRILHHERKKIELFWRKVNFLGRRAKKVAG